MVYPSACFVFVLCLSSASAQTSNQTGKESQAEKDLISKAEALESRGRPDIAVQVWQQILAADPNNAEALAGVARDYRLSGNSTASDEALDKLRKINPADPNIGRIQTLTSNKSARRTPARRLERWPKRAIPKPPCVSTANSTATIRPTAISPSLTTKPSTPRRMEKRKPSPPCAPWPRATPVTNALSLPSAAC